MKHVYPTTWRGQFLIAESVPDAPDAWRHRLRKLEILGFDPLQKILVRDAAGQCVGTLLGAPVDARAGRLPEDIYQAGSVAGEDIDAFVEREIMSLTGSWLFLLDAPGARRLYMDAAGSLPAVYRPETRSVAATSLLLLEPGEERARFRQDLYDTLDILRDGWFPAGLTAHEGVFRLMPNHYLDLDDFTTHRHWPQGEIAPTGDPHAACGRILECMRATMRPCLAREGLSITLTAGNETRMLLAAARPFHEKAEFVTVDSHEARLDRVRAGELARRFGLNHRLVPIEQASAEQACEWHARTGYCAGGPHLKTHPTAARLAPDTWLVGGVSGEVGRGFFWRESDDDDTEITPEGLWARMGLPSHPDGIEAVADWLEEVRGLPSLLKLDLAYLELRVGSWGFDTVYASPVRRPLQPLVSRAVYSAMLSLPHDWRRMQGHSNRMVQEVIRQGWPDLLDLPIGCYGDWRDKTRLVARALKNPHLVLKVLRKRFG